jgi:hypothetical protein
VFIASTGEENDDNNKTPPAAPNPKANKPTHKARAPPTEEPNIEEPFKDPGLSSKFKNLLKVQSRNYVMTLPYQLYDWHEGVPESDEARNFNMRLHWLTAEILLPGSTYRKQIECEIINPKKLEIMYHPPKTFGCTKRTAVKSAIHSGIHDDQMSDQVINTMYASEKVQAYHCALEVGPRRCAP